MRQTLAVTWDNYWTTQLINQQFEMVSIFDKHQIQELLVADGFSLGYVFGFADNASNFFLKKQGPDDRDAYVAKTFSDLIENSGAGDTLFRYVRGQLKDQAILRGYRKASRDVDEWLQASGGTTPVGLSDHLESKTRVPQAA